MRLAIASIAALILALSGSPTEACSPWTQRPLPAPEASRHFPQGTAVSGIRTDRAIVWVRAAKGKKVRVRASAGEGCEEMVTDAVRPRGGRDRTARIPLQNLATGTWYRYRVETDERKPATTPWAWFRTAPAGGTGFTLAFTADIGPRSRWHKYVVDQLTDEEADLLLFLGDWPYADVPPKALDLLDFRKKYRDARAQPIFRRMSGARGVEAVWDDHELKNNWDGKDAKEFPELVEAGTRAWRDYFVTAGAPRGEIYRKLAWGDVDIFLLDTRSHRSSNTAKDGPRKTMLGKKQLRWLLAGLTDSKAAFKLVCTSVPLDYGTTGRDQWPSFSHERDKLLSHIGANGIEGVVFLTGDQHWFAAHHLPSGAKQFQAGPLSQFLRTPGSGVPPAVRVQAEEHNYATVRYDPSPPRLTIVGRGAGEKELYREVVVPGRGQLVVEPPHPFAQWSTAGAHIFYGTGAHQAAYAPAGAYKLAFAPATPDVEVPPPTQFVINPGGAHQARWATPVRPRVWDTFDGPLAPDWTVVDQGEKDPTSDWRVQNGYVRERGNAFDVDDAPDALPKLGTMLVRAGAELREGSLVVRAAAYDYDGFGLVYHYRDPRNYHRVAFHPERRFVRLVRVRDGVATALGGRTDVELPRRWWTTYAVRRAGDVHEVYVGGERLITATDAVSGGTSGLYAWGMKDIRFDDFAVIDR